MHDDDADQNSLESQEPDDHGTGIEDDATADENLVELVNSEPRFSRPRMGSLMTVFTIQNLDNYQIAYHLSGARPQRGGPLQGWRVNFGSLNVQMNDMGRFIAAYHEQEDTAGREAWRHAAEEIGRHLYNGLINTDPGLANVLTTALRRTFPAENLTLVFEGARDYLSVPYELLHDGETPLALRHPICRQIQGITAGQRVPFHTLIDTLNKSGAPLHVLLISSGERHVAADQEIEILETSIQENAGHAGIDVRIDTVWANPGPIKRRLAQGDYHIVHYSGQVYHDRLHPENAGLVFAPHVDNPVGHVLLTAHEIARLLRDRAPHLFFISASVGPQDWDEYVLRESDHFGLFETLVQAGIPAVLGFRWFVTNEGRLRFAERFYQHLLTAPFRPERAVLHARQAVSRWDWQDETWASPMLVAPSDQSSQSS